MKKIITIAMSLALTASFAFAQAPKRLAPMSKAAIVAKQSAHKTAKPHTATAAAKDGCTVTRFPYLEQFEDTVFGCWHTVDADGDGLCWDITLAAGYGMAGSGCAASASYDNDQDIALTPDNWLISPRIRIPATGLPLELSWYVAAQDGNYPADYYTVYISTTDSATSSFTTTVFSETIASENFEYRAVNLAAYAGRDIFVAFRHHNCSDEFVMKIDNVGIQTAGMPIVRINGPSTAIADDTATFTATVLSTDTSAITTTWSITGTTPTTHDTTAQAVWNTAGRYIVVARVTNAIGTATDTLNVTVIDCHAITSLPWSQDFETGTLGCWTAIDVDGDDETWVVAEGTGRNGSYGLVSSSYDGDQVQDNWLISQPVTIPQNGSYELSWYVMPYATSWHEEHYGVYISTTTPALSSFTDSIFVETTPAMTDYARRLVSLAAYAGQTIYIAFRHHCVDQYYLLIDDIAINPPSAPSASIMAPASATSVETVVLKADVSSVSPVTYSWRIDGATPSTATTDSVAVNWHGAPDGRYGIYLTVTNAIGSTADTAEIVITNCDGHIATFPYSTNFASGLECWTTIDADGDEYDWFSDDSLGMLSYAVDPLYMMFGYVLPMQVNDYLITPAIDVPTGSTTFKVTANSYYASNNFFDSLEIRLSTTNSASAAAFSTVLKPQTLVVNETHQVSLSNYAGQTVYVAIVHKGYGNGILNVSGVEIVNTPSGGGDGEGEGIETAGGSGATSVYPNPANDKVNVTTGGTHTAQLLDACGRTLLTSTAQSHTTFDISGLPSGIYFVRTTTAAGTNIQKIIKK